jgi:hypothetical protein
MSFEFIKTIKGIKNRSYWNRANTIEFFAFMTKIVIIVPGLLFGIQFWWLYIFALISSIALVWTSTVKTLPTIILFNILWIILASTAILNNFFSFLPE